MFYGGDNIFIYKITNIINNCVYIGQTINSVESRFARHISDALSKRLDTHFARAIRKYGVNNFTLETIDEAKTKAELDEKEKYWIAFFHSNTPKYGYNMTDGGDFSNTYSVKSQEEMQNIKQKISESKKGEKNPHASAIKIKNVITGLELHFLTVKEVQIYFNEDNHNFVTRRCLGKTKYLYKGVWMIAYEDKEYGEFTLEKVVNKSRKIKVKNLSNGQEQTFCSYAQAERYFNLPLKTFSSKASTKGKNFQIKNYYITVLD